MTPQTKLSNAESAAPQREERRTKSSFRANERRSEATLFRDDFDRDVWCLLGVPVDITDINGAVGAIDAAVRTGERLSFVTPNVNWLVRSAIDDRTRAEILNANLSLVDGAPLVWLAGLLGVPVKSRVAGSDVFEALRRRPDFAGRKIKVFFFGGRDGAAENAVKELNAAGGGVEAVGFLNPGFGDVESMSAPKIIDAINNAKPDFVVVALGAAKGQAWIDVNKDKLTAPVVAHLGAVVDFAAGTIRRSPKFFQKLGLEWLWRIREEPSLWRRYLNDGAALLRLLVTGVFPQIRRSSGSRGASSAHVKIEDSKTDTTIVLAGRFDKSNLAEIRSAFRMSVRRKKDVVLNFASIDGFDMSFLGQILMLEKALTAAGLKVSISNAKEHHLKILRANRMHYPAPAIGMQATPEILAAAS